MTRDTGHGLSVSASAGSTFTLPATTAIRNECDPQSGLEHEGLNGVCDYIISLSSEQLELEALIITIVEAKNGNIKSGYAQCISEMYAASLYNASKQRPIQSIYGVVTTGSLWNFLKFHDEIVAIDRDEYHISNIGCILNILIKIVHSNS